MFASLTLLALGGVSIVLPSNAKSSGLEISVAEIATVRGDDAAEVARVKAASLGYAPAPGYHRTLRADLMRASLKQSLPGIDIRFEGAPRCRVAPDIVTMAGTEIRTAAATELRAALAGLDASAQPEGAVPNIDLPRGDFKPRIVAKLDRGTVYPGIKSVPVEIWLGGQLYRTVNVNFRVRLWQRRAVLERAINAGDPLHASMFRVKRVPVESSLKLHVLGLEELAGSISLKALPAGVSVSERDVHREVIVRRGDTVTVRVMKGSVAVADIGIASRDARMGERIGVKLRSTGVELVATVKGRQSVEVKIQ